MSSVSFDRDFTVSEAAWAANVDVNALRSWLKRGKFSIATETRKWTRFSFIQLCQVAVFAETLASNASHVLAQYLAAGSKPQFERMILSERSNGELPTIYVLTGREVDGGGNQIGGIVFDDREKLEARIRELLLSRVGFFQVVDLTAIFARVKNEVAR